MKQMICYSISLAFIFCDRDFFWKLNKLTSGIWQTILLCQLLTSVPRLECVNSIYTTMCIQLWFLCFFQLTTTRNHEFYHCHEWRRVINKICSKIRYVRLVHTSNSPNDSTSSSWGVLLFHPIPCNKYHTFPAKHGCP